MNLREIGQRWVAGGWRRALPWVLGALVGMMLGAACSPRRYTFLLAGRDQVIVVCDHLTGRVRTTFGD